MLLLREINELNDVQILTEGEGASKRHTINGIFMQADIKNKNGRMYPGDILEREVKRYIKEYIDNERGLGELGHPANPSINLDRVSHKITSITREGSNFIGKATILGTPMGNIVKNLMDEGVKIGVSSRGLGSLEEKCGIRQVCEDYRLVTPADIVSDPSGPECFVDNLMEGAEWIFQNDVYVRVEKDIKAEINNLSRAKKLDEAALIHVFDKMLKMI